MCIIIASVCLFLSYSFFMDNQYINGLINLIIAIGFLIMMYNNIRKTKEYIRQKNNNKGNK